MSKSKRPRLWILYMWIFSLLLVAETISLHVYVLVLPGLVLPLFFTVIESKRWDRKRPLPSMPYPGQPLSGQQTSEADASAPAYEVSGVERVQF